MSRIKTFGLPLRILLFALLSCDVSPAESRSTMNNDCIFYVSTYTGAKSKGIYEFHLNPATGALSPMVLAAETTNPTCFDLDPHGKFLYAVNEINDFEGKPAGSMSAYAIESGTGKLTLLNRVSTLDGIPCHVFVDRAGRNALAANFSTGSAVVLPIKADGSLRAASTFARVRQESKIITLQDQEGPHAHCVMLDNANRFAFVCELGIDKIMMYRFDAAKGILTPNVPPFLSLKPGTGPRHLVFDKGGRFAYLADKSASAVTVFAYDSAHGKLRELQTISTLPDDFKGDNTTAEVIIGPSGKLLYASNRGHDSIAIFGIDPRKGTLTLIGRDSTLGRTPRNFAFDPTGKFVVVTNQDSNKIVVLAVAPKTGRLLPTGHEAEIDAPVCVKFLPLRKD